MAQALFSKFELAVLVLSNRIHYRQHGNRVSPRGAIGSGGGEGFIGSDPPNPGLGRICDIPAESPYLQPISGMRTKNIISSIL